MSPRAPAGPRGTVGLHEFIVMANEEVARDAYRLEISSSVSQGLEAGQFINVAVPGDASHILRIPLSFSRTDPANACVELFYAIVGEGTRRLSAMRAGAVSTAVGPCGKGWRLPDEPAARCLLVAGGIGLPPIFAAAEMLARAGVRFDAIVGAQTEAKLVFPLIHDLERLVADDCRVVVATDDGSSGSKGFTTTVMERLVSEHAYGCVYTCGPEIMMRGIAAIAARGRIACQASLERMMGCGFGACGGCNVPLISGGYASCCMDGPVFDAKAVAW
ncbi:dihydroorotate dehydrogenase electron transfer subunit [Coriobacteriales bacterium OH1046]|nr:dihydroorotate dehydrogenase electron transfer subunit [Coriobacteriales bacterium OH1046]